MEKIDVEDIIKRQEQDYKAVALMLSKSMHDLNNPLSVLVGQTSILEILNERDKLNTEKIEHIVTKLKSSTNSFQERIQQLRSFYSILNAKEGEEVSSEQLIRSVAYLFSKYFMNNNIDFEIITLAPAEEVPFEKTIPLFLLLKSCFDVLTTTDAALHNGKTLKLTYQEIVGHKEVVLSVSNKVEVTESNELQLLSAIINRLCTDLKYTFTNQLTQSGSLIIKMSP